MEAVQAQGDRVNGGLAALGGDGLAQGIEMGLDEQTLLALASTVYYKVKWNNEFWEELNTEDIFHAPSGDRTVTYMNTCLTYGPYYYGEDYAAVSLRLEDGSRMWLILPDKGHTVEEILESDDYLRMTLDPGSWENQKVYKINLSLPKFDVVSQQDLIEGMKNLGVTDIFNS